MIELTKACIVVFMKASDITRLFMADLLTNGLDEKAMNDMLYYCVILLKVD